MHSRVQQKHTIIDIILCLDLWLHNKTKVLKMCIVLLACYHIYVDVPIL